MGNGMSAGCAGVEDMDNMTQPGAMKPVIPAALKAAGGTATPGAGTGVGDPAPSIPPPKPQDLLCQEPRPSVRLADRGITLFHLQALVSSGAVSPSWTIAELVEHYVKPSTAAANCPLVDLVPADAARKPTAFVCHTWKARFGDLLTMLEAFYWSCPAPGDPTKASTRDLSLWIDFASVNQQQAHEYEVASVNRVVAVSERTLLCLDPDCFVLTRVRCLFEIWNAVEAKGYEKLHVLTSKVDIPRLKQALQEFDVSAAEASFEDDKEYILERLRGDVSRGPQTSQQLKSALMDAVVYNAQHCPASGQAQANVHTQAADILRGFGRTKQAELLYEQALKARDFNLGPDAELTLASAEELAQCKAEGGRLAEAEPLFRRVVEASAKTRGEAAPETLAFTVGLATCIDKQGRHAEAEPLFREAVEGLVQVLGPEDLETAKTTHSLATCLQAQGRKQEAEAFLWQVLETFTHVLGTDNLETVSVVDSLAACISDLGRHAEAELMCRQAVEARTHLLGPMHPDTVRSCSSLAQCIHDQGRRAEAETLRRQILGSLTTTLGPDHADTIAALMNLASCLNSHGRRAEAEPLYAQAAEAGRRGLGASHATTLTATCSLAEVILIQGRRTAAEPLFKQVMDARARTLGKDHVDTISATFLLANSIGISRSDESEALYREAIEKNSRVLGAHHSSTGDMMFKLAELMAAEGRRDEAHDMFALTSKVYAAAYGPEHSKVHEAATRAGHLQHGLAPTSWDPDLDLEARIIIESN